MRKSHRLWTLTFFTGLAIFFPIASLAQGLGSASNTLKLNSRTIMIQEGWSTEFILKKPAQAIASLQLYSETSWEESAVPGVVLGVAVDGRLRSHVVTVRGRAFHYYEVHLGHLNAGSHTLEVLRADSSKSERERELKMVNVRLDLYEEDHPHYVMLAHAPLLFGRRDGRHSDVPLLLAYTAEYDAARRPRRLTYTVVYSNEDAGTPPPGLLHRWGRYADIEWAYRVELEPNGERKIAYYQGRNHKTMQFRGGLENNQPTLQIITRNNMLSDTLASRLRFALPPRLELPEGEARERLLLMQPWTWQVSAAEARREQQHRLTGPAEEPIADLRRYLFVEFHAQPLQANRESGGFFIAKYRNAAGEYASHLWSPQLVITSSEPYARQTALPLPEGTTAEDLLWLDFVADPAGSGVILTAINQLFALDEQDLPRIWRPSWSGRVALQPGETMRFHIEGFHMKRAKALLLTAENWSFKIDPWLQGSPTRWGDGQIHEQLWPKVRLGDAWQEANPPGYEGVSWYRHQFTLDRSWRGEKVWLRLGEVAGACQVWLNNKSLFAAESTAATTPEKPPVLDLTPAVRFEQPNSLVIRVDGRGTLPAALRGPVVIGNLQSAVAQHRPAAMMEPSLDESEPFEYLRRPWALLGAHNATAMAQVTAEGFIYTGASEIMFFGGTDLQPLTCRDKTLQNEYLPIVSFGTSRDSVRYRFKTFTAWPADSAGAAQHYVEIEITNTGKGLRTAPLGVGVRFRGEGVRLPGTMPFQPEWQYRVAGRQVLRGGQVICILPETPPARIELPARARLTAHEMAGLISYQFSLAAGESRRLVLMIPARPLAPGVGDSPHDPQLAAAQTAAQWQKFLEAGARFDFPEAKIGQTLRAHLIYNAILFGEPARLNPSHFGQAGEAAAAFDLMGHHSLAEKILRGIIQRLPANRHAVDSTSTATWETLARLSRAVRQHLEFNNESPTGRAFLQAVRDKLQQATGHSPAPAVAWQVCALENAATIARVSGLSTLAEHYLQQHEGLQATLRQQLFRRSSTSGTTGASKRMTDAEARELLQAAVAAQVVDPGDAGVSAAIHTLRSSFEEGLYVRPADGSLDPHITLLLAEAALLRNEPDMAVQDLYALLLHTSASHQLIGTKMQPWSEREELEINLPGEAPGAKLITLVRNMLLREQGRDLHLFPAASPAWMKPGGKITLTQASTKFGRISLAATTLADRLVIDLEQRWQVVPRYLWFHVPKFAEVTSILVDRQAVAPQVETIPLSPHARRVELVWKNTAPGRRTSLAATIDDFRREYRGRHQLWQAQRRP
ncbi:MAG: hypothetical protein ONB48_02290 [candidate division KSB1 bacterium]|nr:hypothetical protein [candidate division KSB1 bacterium]MDZ7272494.1 hypothetical protein [candidate division KSB1 bacterium]MDZ7284482.1 hypothetical protein [candidate division KSB1 bacterium]MDZ7297122.1 hypothetical protein [candidate division KSB1 bacterium]MDZ7306570.1 hypothetical protein [candidate division KSB1 bacterium]